MGGRLKAVYKLELPHLSQGEVNSEQLVSVAASTITSLLELHGQVEAS
jgi:hypothetical protein